jgi:Ca2+-binding EF-hand superfamily protein
LTEAELKSLYDIEMMLCRKLMQHGHSQRELFLSYDADRSGLMTPQEFAAAAGAVGIRLNNNELTLLVRKYDGMGMDLFDPHSFSECASFANS